MIELRVVVFACFFGMGLFMARGAWAAAIGREERRGDAMRLACFATAVVFCGYQLRAIFDPNDNLLLAALHVLAIGDALFIIRLGQRYGRGPLLRGGDNGTE